MKVHDVFTPGDYPKYTYVERGQGKLEKQLKFQVQRPGAIVTISGPSKSGKSVLVERVVGPDDLISIYGGQIESVDDFWERVLDSLGVPESSKSVSGRLEETQTSAKAGIRAYLFEAGGSVSEGESSTEETIEKYDRGGLNDVIQVNNEDSFVLLIDDFHYLNSKVQTSIGKALKQASEEGLRLCVAIIPHRSDDLTQANPDLQGRVLTLELGYWEEEDLKKIGHKGFEALNLDFPEAPIQIFARESVGSPQLMQQICYNICGLKNIEVPGEETREIQTTREEVTDTLKLTANSIDLGTIFQILNGEGITGGKKRQMHAFKDGSEGDVYQAILRGIAADPIDVSLDRTMLIDKIEAQCENGPPRTSSITQALERMDERISETSPEAAYLEWNDETMIIEIPDPYLIFYLRWADKLSYFPVISL